MAHLQQHQLHPGQRGQHVELVDVAHVPQPDDLALELVLTVGQLQAVLLFQLAEQGAAVDARRHLGDGQAVVRRRGKNLQAHRLEAGPGRRRVPRLPGPDVLDPLRPDAFQAHPQGPRSACGPA